MKKVHLIAIGGSAMHNMALALTEKGYEVSGSDDEINEPSKSRLANADLLPASIGWFSEKITRDLDAVIVGMHARAENPELIKAPKSCIEYVIIHELCHLIHRNDTQKFIDLQRKEMKEWEKWKTKLEKLVA